MDEVWVEKTFSAGPCQDPRHAYIYSGALARDSPELLLASVIDGTGIKRGDGASIGPEFFLSENLTTSKRDQLYRNYIGIVGLLNGTCDTRKTLSDELASLSEFEDISSPIATSGGIYFEDANAYSHQRRDESKSSIGRLRAS
ncbi:hypothetical protein HZH68_016172 [Vespula germanica]|uniref:Uncharacterized protein n=1 Tax=Vespula germanica TaxID=30212 RepID=A0A834J645_VESGE|nr:hypothetical protein HZH68_016172 [Vespula germanica]